jgi:hypothetical protein
LHKILSGWAPAGVGWDVEMRGAGRKEGNAEWRSGTVTGPRCAPAGAEKATPPALVGSRVVTNQLYSRFLKKTKGCFVVPRGEHTTVNH